MILNLTGEGDTVGIDASVGYGDGAGDGSDDGRDVG